MQIVTIYKRASGHYRKKKKKRPETAFSDNILGSQIPNFVWVIVLLYMPINISVVVPLVQMQGDITVTYYSQNPVAYKRNLYDNLL